VLLWDFRELEFLFGRSGSHCHDLLKQQVLKKHGYINIYTFNGGKKGESEIESVLISKQR
jgi:hypothetical protein